MQEDLSTNEKFYDTMIADCLFMADFRIWVVAFRAFKPEQLGLAFAPYAVLFLIYFVANSVSVNYSNTLTMAL